MIIYDRYNRPIDISLIDRFITLKRKSGSNPWPVIEECFKVFESKRPTHYKSHLIHIENVRETRKDKRFASTKDKITGGILRYTLDIPQTVMLMIRCVYKADELPMNREFFMEFARRFPKYRVAEKL